MAEALVRAAFSDISSDGVVDLAKAKALKDEPAAMALLFSELQRCGPQLRVLKLQSTRLGEELAELGAVLTAAPNLLELYLDSYSLGPKVAQRLCQGLERCSHLRALSLANTKLGADGTKAVASTLPQWPKLEQLVLDLNRMGLEGLMPLAEAAAAVSRLEKLYLSGNLLPAEAGSALGSALRRTAQLRKLNLSSNQLGDAGMGAVAAELLHLPLLEKLDVQGNAVSAQGVEPLVAGLAAHCPALQFISLSYNAIGDDGLRCLASRFTAWPAMQYLNVQAADITDAGAVSLSAELHSCPKLQTLRLMRNQLKTEGLRALGESLHRCPTLTICDLYQNPTTEAGERAFCVGLAFSGPPPILSVLGGVSVKKHPEDMRVPVEFRARSTAEILAFLSERQGGGGPIKMSIAKVLVSGPGGCGKTSCIQTLVSSQFPRDDPAMTNGVDVARMVVDPDTDRALELLFYDFGGQAVYATTNQLFLRTRAVFLVLWNPRVDAGGMRHYAEDILHANPAAPLIFVTTQADLGHACTTPTAATCAATTT